MQPEALTLPHGTAASTAFQWSCPHIKSALILSCCSLMLLLHLLQQHWMAREGRGMTFLHARSLIIFFAVYAGIVNNQNFSRYVRFNALQSILLDIILM